MSERIEKHVNQLDAIKNYDKLKSDSDIVLKELHQLRSEMESYKSSVWKNYEADIKKKSFELLRYAFEQRKKPAEQRTCQPGVESELLNLVDDAVRIEANNTETNRILVNYNNVVQRCIEDLQENSSRKGKAKREFEQTLKERQGVGPYIAFYGRFQIYCNKCKGDFHHTLILDNRVSIDKFLTFQSTDIYGSGLWCSVRHPVRVTLDEMVRWHLTKRSAKIRRET